MIKLDYQTDNPRWGWSGMEFADWNSYCLIIGFLSNIRHYQGQDQARTYWDDSISVHIEKNNRGGAWEKEGRIHYYKAEANLQRCLNDLYQHKSAGTGSITCRINSNGFIISLVNDFGFVIVNPRNYIADIFPPQNANMTVRNILSNALAIQGLSHVEIESCLNDFDNGWDL